MDEQPTQIFLPPRERCFKRHHLAEVGETVTCVYCEKYDVISTDLELVKAELT